MENASKALIMAGGVLIGVLIISLAVYLFIDFGSSSARINEQNAQKQLVEFNSKFTSYESMENEITIYDVITVAGYAKENNIYYENDSEYKIIVKIGNEEIQDIDQNGIKDKIRQYTDALNGELIKFTCKIEKYNKNGRVSVIKFTKK